MDIDKTEVPSKNSDISLGIVNSKNLTASDKLKINNAIADENKNNDTVKLSDNLKGISEESKILENIKAKMLQINMTSNEDAKEIIRNDINNLFNKFSNIAKDSSTENIDYKNESLGFDKNNVLSLAGSFIQSQANISQNSVLKLLV